MNQLSTQENAGFMQVDTIEQAERCAKIIATSSFCPSGMHGKPGDIIVALQMGRELGLKPMQALQNIAVINGRPSIYGDAMIAVCRLAQDFEYINEEPLKDKNGWRCTAKRKNEPPVIREFTEEDAKLAGLWGKNGPWKQYPSRMLQMRARGFALRDAFADVLRGIIVKEEAEDMPVKMRAVKPEEGNTYEGAVEVVETPEYITEEELNLLQMQLDNLEVDPEKIKVMLKIDSLEFMLKKDYPGVMNKLKVTREKREQAAQTEAVNEGA